MALPSQGFSGDAATMVLRDWMLLAGPEYGLAAIGVVAGLLFRGATLPRLALAPIAAILVALLAVCARQVAGATFPAFHVALGGEAVPICGAVCAFVFGLAAGLRSWSFGRAPTVIRGTRLVDARGVAWSRGRGRSLRLCGQTVPETDEAKHFKLVGTTGTGKTTAIRGLIRDALLRGDRAVIADPDGTYLKEFHDPSRGDRVLNPLDARACRWDLFGEVSRSHDADSVARALVPDQGGDDRSWRAYARIFVSATIRQLAGSGCGDLPTLHRLIAHAPPEELRELLAGTAASSYLADENSRFFASVRAIASSELAVFDHLASQDAGQPLSIREWIRGEPSGSPSRALFLPYRASHIATLRGLISAWIRLAIFETMDLGEADHRLWFVVDELDALGAVDGLKDALARLRKYGGRCVLGMQSIGQLSGTYGASAAQTIVENCGNTLILRCSAAENGGTARFASTLIGEREVLRTHVSKSRAAFFERPQSGRSYTTQRHLERAVLPAELEQLPDLQGYLRFASSPAWMRVVVRR